MYHPHLSTPAQLPYRPPAPYYSESCQPDADPSGLYYDPASYAPPPDFAASPLDAEARLRFPPPSQPADLQMHQHSYAHQPPPMILSHHPAIQHIQSAAETQYKREWEESQVYWPQGHAADVSYAEDSAYPDTAPYAAHADVYEDSPYSDLAYPDSPMSPLDSIASGYESHDFPTFAQAREDYYLPEERPLYQHRSYTLAAAITPVPGEPHAAPAPAPPTPMARLASPSPAPAEAEPPRRPRGRPRKRPQTDPTTSSASTRLPPAYPFPQLQPTYSPAQSHPHASSSSAHPPSPIMYSLPAPPSEPAPVAMSLDEIPVHDREGKPGQAIFKLTAANTVKEPAKKKPVMACLFCRERKIACGQPGPGAAEQRCNQCVRRSLRCEYPKESRRGQHKRGPRATRVQAITEAALAPYPPDVPAPKAASASASGSPKPRGSKERSVSASQRAVNRVALRKTAILQKEQAAAGAPAPAPM